MDIKKHFHIKKAVIFSISAGFSLSVMAFFVKLTSAYTDTTMIILFRFSISFFYVLIILTIRNIYNKRISLKTNHIFLHIFRALLSLFSMFCLYFALKYIPLVDANLLLMTNSLFIPILGLIFHRKINNKHLIAVIIGFIGVIFILNPGKEIFDAKSLIALASGFMAAITLITMRVLNKYDHQYVSMFYCFFISFVGSCIISLFYWQTPNFSTLCLLILIGVFGIFYQEFLIRALYYAPSKIVSSLLYVSLIFSGILDWLFWKDIPNIMIITGMVIVIFSSILTIKYARE